MIALHMENENSAHRAVADERSGEISPVASGDRDGHKILQRASVALFLASFFLLVFFGGMYVQQSRLFPYSVVNSAYKTLVAALETNGLIRSADDEYYNASVRNDATGNQAAESDAFRPYGCVDMEDSALESIRREFRRAGCQDLYTSKDDISASRFEFIDGGGFAAPILVQAGQGAFTDLCPGEHGCLAVEYSSSGELRHAYPYRPEEMHAANIVSESEFPYEHAIGWSFEKNAEATSVSRYPDGDLMVIFEFTGSFPHGGGVARVSPDGSPVWYRKDYSHHWPHLTDDDMAVVPVFRTDGEQRFDAGNPFAKLPETWECDGRLLHDYLRFIDGDGNLMHETSILDAVTESRYAETMRHTKHHCDPTHLNFARVLGDDFISVADTAPGDIVVSLRTMHAFGVLDGDTHRLKHMQRGSFMRQHSVLHLDGSRFIMFDNSGTDGAHGPSRLLIVDLADGRETTVFPNDDTPRHMLNFFSRSRGRVDVSPDGRRALVADVLNGRVFEIRLSDGAVMNIFHSLHDVSGLEQFPDEHAANAWRFEIQDVSYVK